jgi:hypothetical protein
MAGEFRHDRTYCVKFSSAVMRLVTAQIIGKLRHDKALCVTFSAAAQRRVAAQMIGKQVGKT